ncbi:MAG TPA: hypothetical protein ENJ08_09715 [Gammaproteobacteria bacterium]|nr:hypothetical protein [Gammaproteobacteria bacterium]
MNNYFNVLLDNLLLKKGPQDFPCSTVLMRFSLLINFIVGTLAYVGNVGFASSALANAMGIFLLLLFIQLVLQAFSKPERFVQTITALASVGVVMQVVDIVLRTSFQYEPDQVETAEAAEMAGFLVLFLLLIIWNLIVYTHIFRQAFDVRLPAAVALTLCYIVISQLVIGSFFPGLS